MHAIQMRALRALADSNDPSVGFARYEELLGGSRVALAAVGEFYGLTGERARGEGRESQAQAWWWEGGPSCPSLQPYRGCAVAAHGPSR